MAEAGAANYFSLLDWSRQKNPDGSISATIAELMSQSNEVIQYGVVQEANGNMSDTIIQRVGLPVASYRRFGEGVVAGKSNYAQITEATSLMETRFEIDAELLKQGGDPGRILLNERIGLTEAMIEKQHQTLFYGDATQNPAAFSGLSARYSSISGAASGGNIVDGGGTGSVNASMWLLNFGPRTMYFNFPRGAAGGLKHEDLGEYQATITTGLGQKQLRVHGEKLTWYMGLSLPDWRYNVRIANVDTANLKSQVGAAALLDLMTDALYRVPTIGMPSSTTGNPYTTLALTGRHVWVCNRTLRNALHKQATARVNTQLTFEDFEGKKLLQFAGIPIINCDQLVNTETQVT